MMVLIMGEFSGRVRDAFIARGHDAVSCDLLPTERPGPHFQMDMFDAFRRRAWDMVIAHPSCTRLCNSGVRWLREKNLWADMTKAADDFYRILNLNCERIAVENPIPHSYALAIIRSKYDQIIQPWMFGHGETKATCLWLKNLPPLKPTNIVEGREGRVWKEPPGPNRWKNRSRTYEGIAKAMAEQWG